MSSRISAIPIGSSPGLADVEACETCPEQRIAPPRYGLTIGLQPGTREGIESGRRFASIEDAATLILEVFPDAVALPDGATWEVLRGNLNPLYVHVWEV